MAQNVVLIGLLKRIKGRWDCLPLAHRFYLPKKAIDAKLDTMKVPGKVTSFQTKLQQAVEMVIQVVHLFVGINITVACDSCFGNDGLFQSIFFPFNKQILWKISLILVAPKDVAW